MEDELHVRGAICEAGGWVGGTVIEEVMHAGESGLRGVGLFGGEGTEEYIQGAIHGAGIIQQFTKDLLDPQLLGWVQGGRSWCGWCKLGFFAIDDGGGWIGRILGFGGSRVFDFV